ncbi:MAG: DUF4040 domain-containing protein [Acidimicrobiales bacterium]|nr:DUF4040 domain-containing protein [Acidimicrobiales bacterium]
MTALLTLHAVTGAIAILFGRRLGRRAVYVAGLGPLVTFAWLIAEFGTILDREPITESVRWVPRLGLDFDLRADGFGALMLLLVAGIGVLVFVYSNAYFPPNKEGLGRLIGLVGLFAGSMVGLVLADNLLILYGFWELTTITSFLLIGNDHTDARARAAALQALLVTGAGGLAMLAGLLIVGHEAETFSLSGLIADPPAPSTALTVGLALVLVGAFSKSAQWPFHGWLPGAMVAPTPVSAYLHSATMVKAGVYLIARLAPAFAGPVGWWRPAVVTIGLTTMVVGGLRALRQTDLKLLLAFGTVSQLGMMVAVFGLGTADAVAAGSVLLLGHAAFKAAAFMVVGALDHAHGTRDLRRLPRPERGQRPVALIGAIAAASMAGVPFALGFVAKEYDLEALQHSPWAPGLVTAAAVVGSALTAAYSLRFFWGSIGRMATESPDPAVAARRSPPGLVVPGLVLTAATFVAGVVPDVLDRLVSASAASLRPTVGSVHLDVFHGFNLTLVLSLVALGGGALIFALRRPLEPVLALGGELPVTAATGYAAALRALNRTADRVTGVVQNGSLPIYLGVIVLTAAIVPGTLLLSGAWNDGDGAIVDSWSQAAIAALILGAAAAATALHRRFTAALFLGVVGYAMAGLFVVRGAPDLAVTQVGIETLTTVLFVLVLRRLPDRFEQRTAAPMRVLRIGVAVVVGLTVFGLALATGAEDPATTVSDTFIERAYPDGHGRNVVNVILVDFRGFDTLGEITVLAAAAIGAVALARAGRRPGGVRDSAAPPPVPLDRITVLEVSTKVVFIALSTAAIYLLLAGHNQPGGGFAGGIVAGAAVALRYISGGIESVRRLSRSKPWTPLGVGLITAAGAAIVPLLFGGSVLESGVHTLDVPVLGEVKLTSALAFDTGVFLVVIGLAMMVFESFGDDPPARSRDTAGGTR